MLFNPALIDLTALPADFLSARPNFLTAFDKLWDNQIMPETKICALEGKACHFGRGSNREDLHRNLEFTLRCNISDFWASTPRWRIGIFVWRYDCRDINVAAFYCRIGITPRTFEQSRQRKRYLLNFWWIVSPKRSTCAFMGWPINWPRKPINNPRRQQAVAIAL